MGDWRKDQSKTVRRRIWGQTRGQNDGAWQDFNRRTKEFPVFSRLRFEKLGKEIHCWRELTADEGYTYWTSCLRFVDDERGYWTVLYRLDERRWRSTDIKKLPLGRAIPLVAEFYQSKMAV